MALSIKVKFQELFVRYKTWVVDNPEKATEMETMVKWASYILAGRFNNSTVMCEFVYSGSRLFEMFNDFLVRNHNPQLSLQQYDKLKILVTIVENLEVLLEISAIRLWGNAGRWIVVAVIQLIKAIWRFIMLKRRNCDLITSPPIKPLDRKKIVKLKNNKKLAGGFESVQDSAGVYCLPHSGRVIRSLSASLPPHLYNFKPPKLPETNTTDSSVKKGGISKQQVIAEALHIIRPLSHLTSMYVFGQKSWTPYLLSLFTDLTSLHLHKHSVLTPAERSELAKRRMALMYYLIRSPLFHKVTHKQIKFFLQTVGRHIPLANSICQPLLEYIPDWQDIYAYTWT